MSCLVSSLSPADGDEAPFSRRLFAGWESCVTRSDESRSKLAVGMDWAARASSIGLEFVLPTLLGAYLDSKFGSSPLCVVLGAFLGFGVGMTHILRIAKDGTGEPTSGKSVK